MDNSEKITIVVDVVEGVITLTLSGPGISITDDARASVPYQGHVDNLLLTAVDNLLRKNSIDKSALASVQLGSGIDKNSSLCRIVTSIASAVAVAHEGRK